MDKPAPGFVIRLAEVRVSRVELESVLGVELDRYEPSRRGSTHHAQLSMNGGDEWTAVVEFLKNVGPRIEDLIRRGLIGSASMDFEIFVPTGRVANFSVPIPAQVASVAGQNRIDIEVSFYPVSEET